jgi:putative PEP-CTERM system histidine kinase
MASIVDPRELCNVIARLVSDTFGVPAVTVWLFPTGAQNRFVIGGSTVCWDRHTSPGGWETTVRALMVSMLPHTMPVDFAAPLQPGRPDCPSDALQQMRIRYGMALISGQQILGMITLSERLTREPFVAEDFDLLKTIADQAAVSVQNAQLLQHLLEVKEMNAFQTVSTFFVHDLKNLAAKLSLMVQNLPVHYDNPEFRNDMLQVISKSVSKMNAMCSQLTLFTHTIDLHLTETDLNVLIRETIAELEGTSTVLWHQEMLPLPPIQVDQEQIKKVIGNLLLNAIEAMDDDGEIRLTTAWIDPWVVVTISDNGCGMSREFLTDKLFEPFQTTKSQGLGIGMFHSKKIIESHHGRIEADSIAGRGSTFRVLLPASNSTPAESASSIAPPGGLLETPHK